MKKKMAGHIFTNYDVLTQSPNRTMRGAGDFADCAGPPPGDVRERAAQVCELARDRVKLLDRSLHRRLHYGAYTVNLISRIQHMPDCRCECPTCRRPAGWNSGWDIHLANWVAHTDVAAFSSGERPWPNRLISRPVANRRVREGPPVATRRVRQRRQRVEPEDYDTESHLD